MSGDDPRPLVVHGGAGGVDAEFDDMLTMAALFGEVATELAAITFAMHGYLIDPRDAISVFDPAGRLAFEWQLGSALADADLLALRCVTLDAAVRAAVVAYRVGDVAVERIVQEFHTVAELPGALVHGSVSFWRADPFEHPLGAIAAGGEALIAADPGLVDDLSIAAYALPGVRDLAAVLAASDGSARVRDKGVDTALPARTPPRTPSDLLAGTALRDEGQHGEVDVRIIQRPDGRRAIVVDLPGLKSQSPNPYNHDIAGLASGLRAVNGLRTAYQDGVLIALRRAGVTAADDVMLVGHSLGGMVAVNTAVAALASGEFRIRHVLVAGAPIGRIAGCVPKDIQLLAIENKPDAIPHLDGADNPDRRNVTTVTVDRDRGNQGDNHDLTTSYLPGMRQAEASEDPSVRAFVSSAAAFLDGTSVVTKRYVITRGYY